MASIETRRNQDGRRRYRAIVRRKGYPRASRTFAYKGEAHAWARAVEADMAAGRYRVSVRRSLTVAELVDRYIATIVPSKKTGNRQAQQLGVWRDLVGQYDVDQLRPAHIASARDAIAQGRAPATVVRYLAALSHLFTIAIKDWQVIEANPVRLIMWPREPRGRVRFLSDDERDALIAACGRSRCGLLTSVVMLALLTGMRRGEILGLRWKNVDLERKRLILTETKNNERRQVPLVGSAMVIIRTLAASSEGYFRAPGAFVFASRLNPWKPLNIDRHWPTAVKRAGIEDFRFHDLRHTAASYLAMTGATTNEIAEILGHKTLSMVKRYAHLTTSHSAKVLDRMEAEVFVLEPSL